MGSIKRRSAFKLPQLFPLAACSSPEPTVIVTCLSTHWYVQDRTLTQAKSTDSYLISSSGRLLFGTEQKAFGKTAQELPCLIMSLSCTRLNEVLAHQSLIWWLVFCKLRPALFLWSGQEHLFLQHKSEHSAAATIKQTSSRKAKRQLSWGSPPGSFSATATTTIPASLIFLRCNSLIQGLMLHFCSLH